MSLLTNKLIKSDNLYNRTQKSKSAVALGLRYWIAFKTSGDVNVLAKGSNRVLGAYHNNSANTELYFMVVFLCIEQRNYEKANHMLSKISQNKNYFKGNHPLYFGIYIFLEALREIRQDNLRTFTKQFKVLSEYNNVHNNRFAVLLGALKLELDIEEAGAALPYFLVAYRNGERGGFLFVGLYLYFDRMKETPMDSELLLPLINWGLAQGVEMGEIINRYKTVVTLPEHNPIAERIFAVYPEEWFLTEICRNLIQREDYSESAYRYYREAILKQLLIPDLHVYMVRAAYVNGIEDISRYPVEQFLKLSEFETGLKAYVYHLILTNEKMKGLEEPIANEILQFAMYALANNITGRYYNSIYRYFLEQGSPTDKTREYWKKAEGILLDDLFVYEIRSDDLDVKTVWIIEKEKRDTASYELTNGRAFVRTATESFSYVCFSDDSKTMVESKLQIIKMIENTDVELVTHYYRSGYLNHDILNDVLIYLAKHHMTLGKAHEDTVDVLSKLVTITNISQSFKMQTIATLASFLYTMDNQAKALAFYRKIDQNYLNEKYIEQMLNVFVSSKDYEKASQILINKSHCVSDRVLFLSLKQISQVEKYRSTVADVAYELILKSWYDKALLDLVLQYYKGSQSDWIELSKALAAMSVYELKLDEIILHNAIWMHKTDEGAQKVYCRMYQQAPKNDLIGMFTYYLIYEIMINNLKPSYETIGVLEKIYEMYPDKLLSYGLSHAYLLHGISTSRSDEILSAALAFSEDDNLLFPVFKNNKDKKMNEPYIDKNQPFVYRSLPNKNVLLYYKVDGENEFRSKKMEYFRFGLYFTSVTNFYNEELTYYFSEELPTGSIVTKEQKVINNRMSINQTPDAFFSINNALIYEQMFKYEQVESIITESLKDIRQIKGMIL